MFQSLATGTVSVSLASWISNLVTAASVEGLGSEAWWCTGGHLCVWHVELFERRRPPESDIDDGQRSRTDWLLFFLGSVVTFETRLIP